VKKMRPLGKIGAIVKESHFKMKGFPMPSTKKKLAPLLSMPNLIDVNVDRNRFKLTCPFRDKSICTGID
jgi:hypothetical protein